MQTTWKVGDEVHPKGAPRRIKETVVFVDDERVTTVTRTRAGNVISTTRTLEEMDRYCEPW